MKVNTKGEEKKRVNRNLRVRNAHMQFYVSNRSKFYHLRPDCSAHGAKDLRLVTEKPERLKLCRQCDKPPTAAQMKRREQDRLRYHTQAARHEAVRLRRNEEVELKREAKRERWTKIVDWLNTSSNSEAVSYETTLGWSHTKRNIVKARYEDHVRRAEKAASKQPKQRTDKNERLVLDQSQNYLLRPWNPEESEELRLVSERWHGFCMRTKRWIPHFLDQEEWLEFAETFESPSQVRLELESFLRRLARLGQQFPLPILSLETAERRFKKLVTDPKTLFLAENTHTLKWKLDDYPLGEVVGVITWSNGSNVVSNYFHRDNRFGKASRTSMGVAPLMCWHGTELSEEEHTRHFHMAFSQMWSLRRRLFLTLSDFRTFALKHGVNQFSLRAAVSVLQYFRPKTVVDFASGWGDRLAAFWTCPTTQTYCGTDPAQSNRDAYLQQCIHYDRWRWDVQHSKMAKEYPSPTIKISSDRFSFHSTHENKRVLMFCLPAQEVPWGEVVPSIDLIFTSPPYASTETYECGSMTFEFWRDDFLRPTLQMLAPRLSKKGRMAINLDDPKTPVRLPLCKTLADIVSEDLPELEFVGTLAMCIASRPHLRKNSGPERKVEPIYIWQKRCTEQNLLE